MNFQVLFNKQVFLISQDFANYYDLQDQLKANIPSLPELYSISFIGAEKSKMTVNNQNDLEALYHLGKHQKTATLQIKDLNEDIFNMAIEQAQQQIKPQIMQFQKDETSEETETISNQAHCSGCQINPILGIRYKCPVCIDFDLCQKCQDFIQHEHDLIKIKHRKNSTILSPKNLGSSLQINGVSINQDQYNQLMGYSSAASNQKSIDQITIENASCIQQLFGISYQNAYEFVQNNPGLTQQQLIELAIQMQKN